MKSAMWKPVRKSATIKRFAAKDRLEIVVFILLALFIILNANLGYSLGLIRNGVCLKFLGCNSGYFGYDALVHFESGMLLGVMLVWFSRIYPTGSLLRSRIGVSVIGLISTIALLGFVWETAEFLGDQYRIRILHKTSAAISYFQASNSDTMGDMAFSLLGSAVILAALRFGKIDSLTARR